MQIAAVPWNKVGHDLAGAVLQTLVAAGKALQDDVHIFRAVIFQDQIMAGLELVHVTDSLFQHLPVLVGQPRAMLKLLNERGGHPPSRQGDLSKRTPGVAMRYKPA